jgi:hypothetical protein
VIQLEAERPRVVELARVDAGGRAAGDVADVVRARAARGEPGVGEALQHLQCRRRPDLPHLQVGARRDVRVAAAEIPGDGRYSAKLFRIENSVRNAQPQHEAVLRRRDVEEPVELVEEDVGAPGELALRRVGRHLVPDVERVPGALRLLLARELAASGEGPVLRLDMDLFGAGRQPGGRCAARHRESAAEALEVDLLRFGEFAHLTGARTGSLGAGTAGGGP